MQSCEAKIVRRISVRPSRRPSVSIRPLAVCLVFVAGCGPMGEDEAARRGEGPGGREQPLALSPAEELNVGRQAYREALNEHRDQILPSSDQRTIRARNVVERLAKASQIEPLQREINLRIRGYTFEWEVTVIRDSQVNAFCLPGGKMVVFTGILPVAETDDQLATVLSHEMAHALAHHGSERVARERSGGNILRKLQYDRYQESEADKIGVFLMPFAGYDPEEAVQFWIRMTRMGRGGQPPEILSDHPSDMTRIRQLRAWAPRAKAAKQAYDEGRIAR
jgi:metalloendopeptidase OMA1, mitochondrial